MARWQPLQYVGGTDDIAQAALFLASDAARGKESSDAEAPEKEAKQHEYQPNDKCATHSATKGQSQFPHSLCLVRHLLECDNTA